MGKAVAFDELDCFGVWGVAGDDQDPTYEVWPDFLDLGDHLLRGQVGTSQVEQDGVKAFPADHAERLLVSEGDITLATQASQQDAEKIGDGRIAFDDQDLPVLPTGFHARLHLRH